MNSNVTNKKFTDFNVRLHQKKCPSCGFIENIKANYCGKCHFNFQTSGEQ